MDGSWDSVQTIAAQQGGRLHWNQLESRLRRGLIESWIRRSLLTRVRPKVYALGYVKTDLVARTWDAILYAGPARTSPAPPAHITAS